MTPDGVVSTVAGAWKDNHAGRQSFSNYKDGPLKADDKTFNNAGLSSPRDVAVDKHGNIYVADTGNHAIRKISPDGQMTTVAGAYKDNHAGREAFSNYKDGPLKADDKTFNNAGLSSPQGVALDKEGNIYVADTGNHAIRKISPDSQMMTVAGAYKENHAGRQSTNNYKDGPLKADDKTFNNAGFNSPMSLAIDTNGNVLVADSQNHAIRRIINNEIMETVAGHWTMATSTIRRAWNGHVDTGSTDAGAEASIAKPE